MPEPEDYDSPDNYDELVEQSRKPWGRRILTGLIALAALGGFAMVVVYSYDRGKLAGSANTAPTLVAKEGPTRVKPADPGGMNIPDQDKKVFGEINPTERKPPVERLLPPPEPVMEKPAPEPVKPAEKMVAPAVTKKDTTIPAPPPPTPTPAKEAAKTVAPPPAPPKTEAPAVIKKTPPPVPEPPKAKQAQASAGKAYSVQIASFRSRDAANTAWARLASKHKDLLGGLRADIIQTEIRNRGTWYRLRAAPISDAAAAGALCDKLKSRKVGCFIVRP